LSCVVFGGFDGIPKTRPGDEANGAIGFFMGNDGEVAHAFGGESFEDGEEVFVGKCNAVVRRHGFPDFYGAAFFFRDAISSQQSDAARKFIVFDDGNAGEAVIAHETYGIAKRGIAIYEDWEVRHDIAGFHAAQNDRLEFICVKRGVETGIDLGGKDGQFPRDDESSDDGEHGGAEQPVTAGHLGDHDDGGDGGFGGRGKEGDHADDGISAGMRNNGRKKMGDGVTESAAKHPAGDDAGTENAAGISRTQSERGTDDFSEGGSQKHEGRKQIGVLRNGKLGPAVAGSDNGRNDHSNDASAEAANSGGNPKRKAFEEFLDAIIHAEKDARQQGAADSKQGEENERERMGELGCQLRGIEDGLETGDSADDGVPDNGGDEAGNEGFDLEVFLVEDFRGDDGAGERSFENGGDARAQAGRESDVALAGRKPEKVGDGCASGGADLGDGAFAPGGHSAADGDGGSNEFEGGGLETDFLAVVEGANGGVGADARCLRGKLPGQKPADQARYASDERQNPQTTNVVSVVGGPTFAAGKRRRVIYKGSENELRDEADEPGQSQSAKTRADADEDADEAPFAKEGSLFAKFGDSFQPGAGGFLVWHELVFRSLVVQKVLVPLRPRRSLSETARLSLRIHLILK
jgi:hypothetical protein